jgi:hypothetical protein
MFSILICSVNSSHLEKIKINIQETIGNQYELLVWDNLMDPKPITEVYNLLATKANYPFWCFVHEDIRFLTKNWSVNLLNAFNQHPGTGLIGIAGAKYKSRTPSGWSTGIYELDCCNIFHQDKLGENHHLYNNPGDSILEPVVNIDGVFMAVRREAWKDSRFNEKILRGFHVYDIDLSNQIIKSWHVAVIFNIDILHFTEGGNYGDEWVEFTLAWHKEFYDGLPKSLDGQHPLPRVENKIRKNWLYRLRTENISFRNKWKWVGFINAWNNPGTWPYICLFLFGKNFRRKVRE